MSFSGSIAIIHRYSVLLIAFFIPVHIRYTGLLMGIATITWLMQNRFRIRISNQNVTTLLGFTALYLCYAVGMLYSGLQEVGWQKMQLRLSMLLFPLLFFSERPENSIDIETIMKWFISGGVVVSIYLLDHAAYLYLAEHSNIFWGQHITFETDYSVTYLSIYFVVMIAALVTDLQKKEFSLTGKVVRYATLFFLIYMLLSLSSRTQIISFVIILTGLIIFNPRGSNQVGVRQIILKTSVITALITLVLIFPSSGERLISMVKQWNEPYTDEHPTSENLRQVAWKVSFDQILQRPLVGVGTGDVDTTLFKIYEEKKLKWPRYDRINSHNQFLQTSLAIGTFGLTSLLTLFITAGMIALKCKDRLYLAFLLVIIISCCTESVFETETGVLFFAFFNSLFAGSDTKEYLRE